MLNFNHYLPWVLLSTLVVGVHPGKIRVVRMPSDQTTIEHDDNFDENFSPKVQKSVRLNQLIVAKLENTLKDVFRGKSLVQSQGKASLF